MNREMQSMIMSLMLTFFIGVVWGIMFMAWINPGYKRTQEVTVQSRPLTAEELKTFREEYRRLTTYEQLGPPNIEEDE